MADELRAGTGMLPVAAEPGSMIERTRSFDWAATPLGDAARWPQSLKTLVELLLSAKQPMFIAWGRERNWLYNDAFVPILGNKHPGALGRPSMQVWDEARAELEPLFDRVFAGEAVHMEGFTLGLDRGGVVEDAVFDFSYTPVRDDRGALSGLFGVCVETTARVVADRREAESVARQLNQFQQAPGFVIAMSGPEHLVDFVNDKHRQVFGSIDWIGKPIRAAFPSITGQGFFRLLDQVYASGTPFQADRAEVRFRKSPDADEEVRFLNFVYAPVLNDDGAVTGVFCDGFDVTKTVLAEQALSASDVRERVLIELAERFRDLEEPSDLSYAAAEVLGSALGVSRAGYGTVDLQAETITIERDWNAPGIHTIAGMLRFRDYGSYIEDLQRGTTVAVADAYLDARTAHTADALTAISAQSFINMPVTEHGGFVALFYLNHADKREWLAEELALMREVAERTRSVVERRRAEDELRQLAASLERQVVIRTEERDRVWRNSRDLIVSIGTDGVFRAVSPAWRTILGHRPEEVVGRSFLDFVWSDDIASTKDALVGAVERADLTNFENRYNHVDGTPRWISWHTAAEGDLVFAYGRDITAQKRAQRELEMAQEALRQSQKMEAVGQLTGGIAHDFNNLLAAISGSLELLARRINEGKLGNIDRFISTAQGASRRAAALTHRLLAFSRQQTLDPRPTEVNRLVAGMEDLIRRSVGPMVELEVVGAGGLWLTKIDPSPARERAAQPVHQRARCDGAARRPADGRDRQQMAGRTRGQRTRAAPRPVHLGVHHRHRHRHDARGHRARLRPLLHDQAARRRHRAGLVDGLRLRAPIGRPGSGVFGAGSRHHDVPLSAALRRRSRDDATCDRRWYGLRRRRDRAGDRRRSGDPHAGR